MGCTPSVLNHSIPKKHSISYKRSRSNSFIKNDNSKSSKTNSKRNSLYNKSYKNNSNPNPYSISSNNQEKTNNNNQENTNNNNQENTNNYNEENMNKKVNYEDNISKLISNNKILRNEISHLEIIITQIVISKYNLIQKHNLDIKKKNKINANLTKSLLKYKNVIT